MYIFYKKNEVIWDTASNVFRITLKSTQSDIKQIVHLIAPYLPVRLFKYLSLNVINK